MTATQLVLTKNCLSLVADYPEPTFKILITSPPYFSKDGYSPKLMADIASQSLKVMKPGSLAFVNCASIAEDWGRPFEIYAAFEAAGWVPVTTVIWIKSMVFPDGLQRGHYTPIQSNRRLNNLFEYVHIFSNDNSFEFDRISAPNGVPFKDKSNLKRGKRGANGDRHCSGNVWFIPYVTTGPNQKKNHVYEYPIELVDRCLALARAIPGDIVLDPFAGSGTTLVAAKKRGLDAVGYEINTDIAESARKRIAAA
jgi:DNA modification methylase